MQEFSGDYPGRCIAVSGKAGDVIVVPPGWVHATISADSSSPLTFGAWCVRNYGLEYDDIRKHRGIAWFPVFNDSGQIEWIRNANYSSSTLNLVDAFPYPVLRIEQGKPIYTQFEEDNNRFLFVTRPDLFAEIWDKIIP